MGILESGAPGQSAYAVKGRGEVVPFVPPDVRNLLDIGCASGGFGENLRIERPQITRLVGVEPLEAEAALARDAAYDEVHVGYFPEAMPDDGESFDCVVLNDVLEHMPDPWRSITDAKNFLRPGGYVVASIPSIQYLPISLRIVRGQWTYTDEGTLDRTHLRFFTKSTMREMFEDAGFEVIRLEGINSFATAHPRRAVRLISRFLGDGQWLQFVTVAQVPA
jgi:2-polyprenyl-3-methyl-5-hydroxy-6-metoxy-1,4-benzoquinol methylase